MSPNGGGGATATLWGRGGEGPRQSENVGKSRSWGQGRPGSRASPACPWAGSGARAGARVRKAVNAANAAHTPLERPERQAGRGRISATSASGATAGRARGADADAAETSRNARSWRVPRTARWHEARGLRRWREWGPVPRPWDASLPRPRPPVRSRRTLAPSGGVRSGARPFFTPKQTSGTATSVPTWGARPGPATCWPRDGEQRLAPPSASLSRW